RGAHAAGHQHLRGSRQLQDRGRRGIRAQRPDAPPAPVHHPPEALLLRVQGCVERQRDLRRRSLPLRRPERRRHDGARLQPGVQPALRVQPVHHLPDSAAREPAAGEGARRRACVSGARRAAGVVSIRTLLVVLLLLIPAGALAQSVPVPEPTAQALAYHRSGNIIWVFNTVWGLLIPALFLWTGFSGRIRDWSARIGRKWFFTVAIYWVIFTLISTIIDLPRVYYEGFLRQHAYGLSNQTIGKWVSDQVGTLAVAVIIGGLVLWIPYLLLARSPRRWWLYTTMLAVPFIMLLQLITPIWVDPLFNTFGPMKDKALETEILQLADRAGIEGGRVFEVAKSVDTKALNAYVNGFGA